MIFSTHIVSSNITITILCFTAARDDEVAAAVTTATLGMNKSSVSSQTITVPAHQH